MANTKEYKVSILGIDISLTKDEMKNILTEKAFILANKVIKQGGELSFGKNSINENLLNNEGIA